jgi:hypothetical protein
MTAAIRVEWMFPRTEYLCSSGLNEPNGSSSWLRAEVERMCCSLDAEQDRFSMPGHPILLHWIARQSAVDENNADHHILLRAHWNFETPDGLPGMEYLALIFAPEEARRAGNLLLLAETECLMLAADLKRQHKDALSLLAPPLMVSNRSAPKQHTKIETAFDDNSLRQRTEDLLEWYGENALPTFALWWPASKTPPPDTFDWVLRSQTLPFATGQQFVEEAKALAQELEGLVKHDIQPQLRIPELQTAVDHAGLLLQAVQRYSHEGIKPSMQRALEPAQGVVASLTASLRALHGKLPSVAYRSLQTLWKDYSALLTELRRVVPATTTEPVQQQPAQQQAQTAETNSPPEPSRPVPQPIVAEAPSSASPSPQPMNPSPQPSSTNIPPPATPGRLDEMGPRAGVEGKSAGSGAPRRRKLRISLTNAVLSLCLLASLLTNSAQFYFNRAAISGKLNLGMSPDQAIATKRADLLKWLLTNAGDKAQVFADYQPVDRARAANIAYKLLRNIGVEQVFRADPRVNSHKLIDATKSYLDAHFKTKSTISDLLGDNSKPPADFETIMKDITAACNDGVNIPPAQATPSQQNGGNP